jgi:hypothetical protein
MAHFMQVNILRLSLVTDAILNSRSTCIKVAVFSNFAWRITRLESCLEMDSDHFLTNYLNSITLIILTDQAKLNNHRYSLFIIYFYET